jgi:hypothetical protein
MSFLPSTAIKETGGALMSGLEPWKCHLFRCSRAAAPAPESD